MHIRGYYAVGNRTIMKTMQSSTDNLDTPETPPLLQRVGERYFRRLSERLPRVVAEDETHILNAAERRKLKAIERWAVFRAGLAGAAAGLAVAIVALICDPMLDVAGEDAGILETWDYWLAVTLAGAVITLFEIAYLYRDALKSVHRLAYAAGLDLFPQADERTVVRNALVQAALELPGMRRNVYAESGREVSKLVIVLVTILYKLKVTITAFIAKALVKRMLGRVLVRAWLEFVAVPVYFFWDAFVAWLVLREARIRAMGPSAVEEIVGELLARHPDPSAELKRAMFLAVGSTIARNTQLHLNVDCLMRELVRKLGDPPEEELGNSAALLSAIGELNDVEQDLVIRLLEVAAMIDGKLSRWESQLLHDAQRACGRVETLTNCRRMIADFRAGRHVTIDSDRATADSRP